MRRKIKKERRKKLIVLVVLLILAGISIVMLTVKNGKISKQQNLKREAETKIIENAKNAVKFEMEKITQESIQRELDELEGEGKVVVTEESEDTLKVKFQDTGNEYKVDSEKEEFYYIYTYEENIEKIVLKDIRTGESTDFQEIYVELSGEWVNITSYLEMDENGNSFLPTMKMYDIVTNLGKNFWSEEFDFGIYDFLVIKDGEEIQGKSNIWWDTRKNK